MGSVKQFYEKTAKTYDKEYDAPYWRLYHEITWENIRKFLPITKDATILDSGGGTGYWAIRLAKHGFNVVLTDISRNMLKVAREKIDKEELQNKIETKIVDIRYMSCFPSNHFDMVLAEGDPVSYCLRPKKAISELARVARHGSHVIVSGDSKYSMISRLIRQEPLDELSSFLRTSIIKGDFRYQAFTPEGLKVLFEECGLKVVRIIGKPILLQSVPAESRDKLIERKFKKLLKLELEFCDVPSIVGMGGHLEVVGIKQRTTLTASEGK